MNEKLAIHGGPPAVRNPLPRYRSMGPEERQAVVDVVDSDCLSGFYGSWGDEFLGGPKVKELERAWARTFGSRHAVSVNSATSGLFAAMGAIGISPGNEVIVPPFTMSATAVAPLAYGGIPVFADIEDETFCLDPDAVRAAITPKTKAILAVNLFGHPAPLVELREIADDHGVRLIEDNAQAPFARENGRYAGTAGDIGVFSLNYHKHIHAGEGGICVTDDDQLALRLQLIRNHGENVVEPLAMDDITNLYGFNYRMTELSAAVGLVQLKNAKHHISKRVQVARRLTEEVADLPGFTAPVVRPDCDHVYYLWSLRLDQSVLGAKRERISAALTSEGFPHFLGYVRPLYRLPVFEKRHATGRAGFPFTLSDRTYQAGDCPVAERLWSEELLCFEACMHELGAAEVEQLAEALRKVHRGRGNI